MLWCLRLIVVNIRDVINEILRSITCSISKRFVDQIVGFK